MTLRLERSTLFVPASRPAMIRKAAASQADAVCIDLEDSVAVEDKPVSRVNVIQAFHELDFGGRLRIFRINGLDTPFAYRDVIEVVEAAGAHLDLIMIPKVNSASDVGFVATLLSQIEAHRGLPRTIGLEAQIETARGFLYVREIAEASRLESLIVGPGDYAASMGMPADGIGELDTSGQLSALMHSVVAAARANGLRALDGPYGKFQDADGLHRLCRIARALGFDGKQCIHPAQIDTVNDAFSPSAGEAERAQEVLRALAEAKGTATGLNGRMLDGANARLARNTVQRFELARSRAGRTP